jgi:hypothetical protein
VWPQVGVLLAGGGGAIAATQFGSSGVDSQAVIDDAAQQLGIDPGSPAPRQWATTCEPIWIQ